MSEERSIHDNVEEQLKETQGILQDNIIESIRQLFLQFNEIPKTFDDYQEIVANKNALNSIVSNIINEALITEDEYSALEHKNAADYKVDEDKEKLICPLKSLQLLASTVTYSKKVNFVQFVLNSPNKKEILFSNILFTSEEDIRKRYKKLALHFHPDTSVFQDRHKYLGNELFGIVLEFKNSLLADLESTSKVEGYLAFHERNANKLWKITVDYRNAAKRQWDKLKVLKKEDLVTFSPKELEHFSVRNGRLAYKEYRAACKIADNAKLLTKQVKLRGYIALCLYVSNNYLEAQLFALSSIQLLIKNSQRVMMQDLTEAKRIFDKVRGGDATDEAPKLSTEINLDDDSDNALALIKIDREFSYYEKKNIQHSIDNDMAMIVNELMLKADRSLISYQTNATEILHAKKRAVGHKIVGGATMAAGAILGGTTIIEAAILTAATSAVAGPFALIAGIIFVALGFWGGSVLWKKGSSHLEEPEIREKLNEIMVNALGAYDKGDYKKFLIELSKEYKNGISLLRLKDATCIVSNDMIIDALLSHGFRSDGIAYLLNLLGEVLNSKKVKIEGKTTKELGELAKYTFNGALNKKLVKHAEKLDDRIRDLRKGFFAKSVYNKIKDAILLKEYSDIAKEHIDDSQKMPFKARLEEMRNIARINLAIFDILDAGPEEITRAVKTIKEIEDSINHNYQFVSTIESRVEALKDLLWIISGEESPEPKLFLTDFSESIQDEDGDKYNRDFHDLNEKLKHASEQEKLQLHISIAAVCEKLAEKEDKTNRIKSLRYWRDAQKNYEKAREINDQDINAYLGFAKCLLKLSKYTQVIELLKTNSFLISLSECWRFLSIAYCKQAKYREANECIIEALKLDHKNVLADKQKSFLQKISKETSIENRINQYNKETKDIRYNLKNSHVPVYNILSIDGGGIRGVLPALWLSEIEHRTHKPISHLFSMIAGTSTGGIIAAGLSTPQQLLNNNYLSPKPKFLASDMLDLYQNQAKCLFTTDFPSMLKMTYSDKGRLSLFEKYFSSIRLKQTLTELVIPAAREFSPKVTHPYLFTRYDASSDDPMNDTLVDTLMATTAAPTYFSSYMLKDKGFFLDGGIHLNNPAESAYDEAIRYGKAKEKISILSLGTGDYIPEPSNPNQYRGQLFWKQNSYEAQQGCTDYKMYTKLGNRYQRWQVYLEDPIKLDDCEQIPFLLEIGHQYIEELDASDENPINKIVESFDDKAH